MMTIVTMIRRIMMISKATIAIFSGVRFGAIVVATIFVVSVSPEVDVLANVYIGRIQTFSMT